MKTAPREGAGSQTPTIDHPCRTVGSDSGYDRKVSTYYYSLTEYSCTVSLVESPFKPGREAIYER